MAPKTSSGQLYEKVAFDERETQSDGHGNFEAGFVQEFQRRASFTYLRGTESVIAARLEGRQPIVVRVRRDEDTLRIRSDWRMRNLREGQWQDSNELLWSGTLYAVKSVALTEDRRWIDIIVESGVAA